MSDPFVDDQTLDIEDDGGDAGQQEETSDVDFRSLYEKQIEETKKFQSLRDKDSADFNKKFSNLENQLGQVIEALQSPKQETQSQEDIDPFEIFTPESTSNKVFQNKVKEMASRLVDERFGVIEKEFQQQKAQTEIKSMLQQQGLTPEQTSGFMEFLNAPINTEMLPVLADSYLRYSQGKPSLEDVRQTQGVPSMAGAEESAPPQQPSDDAKFWAGIKKADEGSNIF